MYKYYPDMDMYFDELLEFTVNAAAHALLGDCDTSSLLDALCECLTSEP